jgi:hypothetical protein
MFVGKLFERNKDYGTVAFASGSAEEQKNGYKAFFWVMFRNIMCTFTISTLKGLMDFYKKNASAVLVHDSMLERIMAAPVNLFFDTHKHEKI